MNRELYDLLGVEPTATADEIKAAYRAKAKTLHPDAGGGAEDFARLNEAFEALKDPARRARYDATGDARPLDAATAEKLEMFLDGLLTEAFTVSAFDLSASDGVDVMVKVLASKRPIIAKAQRDYLSQLKRAREAKGRLKPKPDVDDRIGATLNRLIGILEAKIQQCEEERKLLDQVTALVKGYVYDYTLQITDDQPTRWRTSYPASTV